MQFLIKSVFSATNDDLQKDEGEITLGELLRFIDIWFFLATTAGYPRRAYFSRHPVMLAWGAPYRVNQWMSINLS